MQVQVTNISTKKMKISEMIDRVSQCHISKDDSEDIQLINRLFIRTSH